MRRSTAPRTGIRARSTPADATWRPSPRGRARASRIRSLRSRRREGRHRPRPATTRVARECPRRPGRRHRQRGPARASRGSRRRRSTASPRCRARARAGARAASTTPASPKLSTMRQKMSQRSEGGMGSIWVSAGCPPLSQFDARTRGCDPGEELDARSVHHRRRLGRRVPVVLHRQAAARGGARPVARDRSRPAGRRFAGIPSSSIPTCRRRASTGASMSKRSSAAPSGPRRSTRGWAAAGETVGIPFAFDAIVRQPNTLDAHRLIAWAQTRHEGDADALVEDAVPRLLSRRPIRR